MTAKLTLSEPATAAEFAAYYELRWRELREPWQRPHGSERDDLEAVARHVAVHTADGTIVGVGRIHWNDDGAAQIRYVATRNSHLRRGVGRAVMQRLETIAREAGTQRIIVNARQPAVAFYESLGYEITGDGALLFGTIPHKWMRKQL